MSKKSKPSKKKHQLKQSAPVSKAEVINEIVGPEKPAETRTTKAPSAVMSLALPGHDLSYVKRDLKRVLLVTGGLIALELLCWYLLNHTPVGSAVYSLIKV